MNDTFKFDSKDQLVYVATCLAASNLGFDIDSKIWFGGREIKEKIQKATTYTEKTNTIIYAIANLSEDDVDMERAILSEQKHWITFLKEKNKADCFNDHIIKYINIAEGK